MTKKTLEQLVDLRKEIMELEKRIQYIEQKKIDAVSDTIKESCTDFPYMQGNVKVSGYNEQAYQKWRQQLSVSMDLLQKRMNQAAALETEITEYINNVCDSKIRRMMQYKYIDGYTWKRIADLMHYDKSYPEKAITRYLQKNSPKT